MQIRGGRPRFITKRYGVETATSPRAFAQSRMAVHVSVVVSSCQCCDHERWPGSVGGFRRGVAPAGLAFASDACACVFAALSGPDVGVAGG